MCIRDRFERKNQRGKGSKAEFSEKTARMVVAGGASFDDSCLLYTSDAADERSSVDLGGRRIIKKKNILGGVVTREQFCKTNGTHSNTTRAR